jgi:hypothetical protein
MKWLLHLPLEPFELGGVTSIKWTPQRSVCMYITYLYDIYIYMYLCVVYEVQLKFILDQGHEDPLGEERCSSTRSLTSALDGVVFLLSASITDYFQGYVNRFQAVHVMSLF